MHERVSDPKEALRVAINEGSYSEVKRLIIDNPDLINEKYEDGRTILHLAAAHTPKQTAKILCQILIEAGANPIKTEDSTTAPLDALPKHFQNELIRSYKERQNKTQLRDTRNDATVEERENKSASRKNDRHLKREISKLHRLYNKMIKLANSIYKLMEDFKNNPMGNEKLDNKIIAEIVNEFKHLNKITMQIRAQILEAKDLDKQADITSPDVQKNKKMIDYISEMRLHMKNINEFTENPTEREKSLYEKIHTYSQNINGLDQIQRQKNPEEYQELLQKYPAKKKLADLEIALHAIQHLNKTFIPPGGINEMKKTIESPFLSADEKNERIIMIAKNRSEQTEKLSTGRREILQDFYLRVARYDQAPQDITPEALQKAKTQIMAMQDIKSVISSNRSGETMRAVNSTLQQSNITIEQKLTAVENILSQRLNNTDIKPEYKTLYQQLLTYVQQTQTGQKPDLKSGQFNLLRTEAVRNDLDATFNLTPSRRM